jgi:hypothetical protein
MIPALCIDSSNRPKEIPMGKWIQSGFKYHITHVFFHEKQGIQGCTLHEVRLGAESTPYISYRLSRFALTQENYDKLLQMIIDCSELNDFDVNKLLEECELEVMK